MMDLYQRKKTDSPTQNQEIQSKKRGKIKEKSEEKFFTKKSLDIFFLIHVCHLEYQSRISNLFSFFQSDFKQKRLDLKWHKGHLYNRWSTSDEAWVRIRLNFSLDSLQAGPLCLFSKGLKLIALSKFNSFIQYCVMCHSYVYHCTEFWRIIRKLVSSLYFSQQGIWN